MNFLRVAKYESELLCLLLLDFQLLFWKMLKTHTHIYIIFNASIFIRLLSIQSAHLEESNPTTVCTEILAFQVTNCVWPESHDSVGNISESPHNLICMLQCPQEGRSSFVFVLLHHLRAITSLITKNNLVFIIAFLGMLGLGAHIMCNCLFVLVRS